MLCRLNLFFENLLDGVYFIAKCLRHQRIAVDYPDVAEGLNEVRIVIDRDRQIVLEVRYALQ